MAIARRLDAYAIVGGKALADHGGQSGTVTAVASRETQRILTQTLRRRRMLNYKSRFKFRLL